MSNLIGTLKNLQEKERDIKAIHAGNYWIRICLDEYMDQLMRVTSRNKPEYIRLLIDWVSRDDIRTADAG